MNPLFPCNHVAATHSCIMHDTGRGTLCKKCRPAIGAKVMPKMLTYLLVKCFRLWFFPQIEYISVVFSNPEVGYKPGSVI